MVITDLKRVMLNRVRIYIQAHTHSHTQTMWDVTITPSGDPHGITSFMASQRVPASDPHGLVYSPSISGEAMALIPFVITHPNDTILLAFLSPESDFLRGYLS
jgi:hypothetical protein